MQELPWSKAVHHSFIRRNPCRCTAIVLLLGAMRVGATAEPLTLEETLRIAADRSQQLEAENDVARAARAMAVATGQSMDPVLTVGIDNVPIEGPDRFTLGSDSMTMQSIGIAREFTRVEKRHARAARFVREAEAADAARDVALAGLQRGAAVAWIDRRYGERIRDVLLLQRDELTLQVQAAELAFKNRSGSPAAVLTAQSAAAKIKDRIAASARDIELATVRLERWIGDAAARPLAGEPDIEQLELHGSDVESRLAHHPEITLLAKTEAVAVAEAEIARTNKRADWTLGLTYGRRGGEFSDMVTVNISKPLQWRQRDRQDRELEAKLALAQQMRAEREEETRAHLAEARALLTAWESNGKRLERYKRELLPLADERTTATLAGYRAGNSTLLDVLGARADEIDIELEQLMLEHETAVLWAELNYLIPAGREL